MEAWERCRLPDDISFEEWVRFVFDHPVLESNGLRKDPESGDIREWDYRANPARTLSYITQLFEQPEGLIQRFSAAQVDRGLYFLVGTSGSDQLSVLANTKLPRANRRRCIDAMVPLYKNLMAPLYQHNLGHASGRLRTAGASNFTCYMWWDIIPLHGGLEEMIDDAVLNVFERVLKLRAESCLERVLHGIGHWHRYLPDRTEPIVRRFLQRTDFSPELRRYAERAAVRDL
jgi:hypothetical protein